MWLLARFEFQKGDGSAKLLGPFEVVELKSTDRQNKSDFTFSF